MFGILYGNLFLLSQYNEILALEIRFHTDCVHSFSAICSLSSFTQITFIFDFSTIGRPIEIYFWTTCAIDYEKMLSKLVTGRI